MLEKLLTPFHTVGAITLTPFAAAVAYYLLRHDAVSEAVRRNGRRILIVLCCLCAASVAFFLVGNLVTIPQQRPFQDDESAILSVSAAYLHGQPVYPSLDAPVEYSILYGPVTFLIYAIPMLFHAENLMWFQGWVALALAVTLLALFLGLRSVTTSAVALLALGYAAWVLGMKAENEWSNKGDPWILLFVSLGLWGALRLRSSWADVWVALCGACLFNIKATLLPLALLPFLLAWQRGKYTNWRKVATVALMCLVAFGFFLLPGISLANYRTELILASRHGVSTGLLGLNLAVFLRCFALPFAAAYLYLRVGSEKAALRYLKLRWPFLLLLLLSSAVVVVTGAKYGAGDWHLMPLVVPFAFSLAEMVEQAPALEPAGFALRLAPAVWIFGALGIHGTERTADAVHTRLRNAFGANDYDYRALRQEMLQVAAAHPRDTLQVGIGGNMEFTATWLRQIYIMRGQPLFLDANTRTERDASHVPVSPEVLRAVEHCRITLWLIPKGAPPFSMMSGYAIARYGTTHLLSDPHIYAEPFPSVFLASYHRAGSTANFDLWACNRK